MQKEKILAILKNKKFIFAAIIILVIVFLALLFRDKEAPTTKPSPSPTTTPYIFDSEYQGFKLIGIYPPTPTFESIWGTELITFDFNNEINPETIDFLITPSIKVRIIFEKEKPNTFSILPIEGWEQGVEYNIHIPKKLSNSRGETLVDDINIKIKRVTPNFIPSDHGIEDVENY